MENKEETYFEIGMEVFDIRFGKGIVKSIDINVNNLIEVEFEKNNATMHYIKDGRYYKDENVSLFQTIPIFEVNKPIISFEKGEIVWIRNSDTWNVRYYSHTENNIYYCFINQSKDGKTSKWRSIRKFNDNPLI